MRAENEIPNPPLEANDRERPSIQDLDLRAIIRILNMRKWWIFGMVVTVSIVGGAYLFHLPQKYKSEAIYAPAQRHDGAGGKDSRYGGLAEIAGISMSGGENNDINQALELLKSWPFLDFVVNKYQLKPYLFAVEKWEAEKQELVWDRALYNPDLQKWEVRSSRSLEPTSYQGYLAFRKMIEVSYNQKQLMLKVSVEHQSPILAKDWLEALVYELNGHFRKRDVEAAKSNIEYLSQKVSETGVAEMHAVFYRMIESEMKTLMLAEVGDQYLLEEVVGPRVAEVPSSPNRLLMLAVLMAAAFLFSLCVAFIFSVRI